MAAFLLQRLIGTVPVLLLVSVTIFSLMHLIPGDPVQVMAGEVQDPEAIARIRADLGLDRPLYRQYLSWLGNALQGDLGESIRTREPVLDVVLSRVKPTLQLSVMAMIIGLAVALPVGVISATRRNSRLDTAATTFALLGVSMPNFLIGLLLIFFFSIRLGWLPTSGYVDIFQDPVEGFRSLLLPSITLGMALAAVIMRMTRSSLLEALAQDYIRTARAKGLVERRVVIRHGLRNALIPVVTVVGLQVGNLIAGAVITEYIFAIPGVGRLIVDSVFARDYPVLQGVVLLTVIGFIGANLIADLLYAALDPRIRMR
ncbi:MAG: ABC transporter permease [Thermomicrobiales bacterium]|nr:ABC transporter permease [Thermomicrobiales bacterium]